MERPVDLEDYGMIFLGQCAFCAQEYVYKDGVFRCCHYPDFIPPDIWMRKKKCPHYKQRESISPR